MPAHDVKLDVNATNNSYKIIFEKNKPMNVTNPYTGAVSSASNEITGTVADTFYIYNHANQKLPGNVYNLTGWTFKGWSLKRIIQTDMVLDGNMVQIHGVMTYHI